MKFQCFLPSRRLASYVQFYGLLQNVEDPISETRDLIPPYPCKGLIFSLADNPPVYVYNQDFSMKATEGYFMPQCTQSWHMHVKGAFSLLGVFFRPGMFRHLFPFDPGELIDQTYTFEDVNWKRLNHLQEVLLEPGTIGGKLSQIEQFLFNQIAHTQFARDLTDVALSYMRAEEIFTVDSIADHLGISNRYFRKIFQQEIGLSPKTFLKIQRFHKAFQLLRNEQFQLLSDIAYQLQYFDQSHFIREFKQFTGTTPLQFLKGEHPLQNEIFWREEVSRNP